MKGAACRYRRAGESEARPRKLGPLGLVLKAGVWYLVAQSGKAIRTYRASNIHGATMSDEPFARPRHFDLAAHWRDAVRDYEAGVYHETADVRLLDVLDPARLQASRRDRNRAIALDPAMVSVARAEKAEAARSGRTQNPQVAAAAVLGGALLLVVNDHRDDLLLHCGPAAYLVREAAGYLDQLRAKFTMISTLPTTSGG